jgi:hypothetical protein
MEVEILQVYCSIIVSAVTYVPYSSSWELLAQVKYTSYNIAATYTPKEIFNFLGHLKNKTIDYEAKLL